MWVVAVSGVLTRVCVNGAFQFRSAFGSTRAFQSIRVSFNL